MDKKTIIGGVVVALVFVGFLVFNANQQKKYQEQVRKYQEYLASQQPAMPAVPPRMTADSTAASPGAGNVQADSAALLRQQADMVGETLAGAAVREESGLTVENDVLRIDFSSRGGQIVGVTLKDYTRYAPRGERTEPVQLFDPATARFNLSLYIRNGLNNSQVNTSDYVFEVDPVRRDGDMQTVVMRLPVDGDAAIEYEYRIYDSEAPERDYLVDFDVRLRNMAPRMANQTSVGIDWRNRSYQNEQIGRAHV